MPYDYGPAERRRLQRGNLNHSGTIPSSTPRRAPWVHAILYGGLLCLGCDRFELQKVYSAEEVRAFNRAWLQFKAEL
jgi:hypothetical protein